MATMNKPAANDSNWYQAVTDNWTSIETNLVDKNLVTAKGDLLAATAASSLTRLPAGATGSILTADSGQPSGLKWSSTVGGLADVLLLKPFFSSLGLLPSTTIQEATSSWPTPDITNLNAGTLNTSMSRIRFTSSGNPANLAWNAGAQYDKMLIIMGLIRPMSFSLGLYVGKSSPLGQNTEPDGYIFAASAVSARMELWQRAVGAGAFGLLASDTSISGAGAAVGPSFGLALYVDASTSRVVGFVRVGTEVWWPVFDVTDSTTNRITKCQYAGLHLSGTGNVFWAGCPMAIYVA